MLNYKTRDNEIKTYSKIKGLALNSVHVEKDIDWKIYDNYIDCHIQGLLCTKAIHQLRKKKQLQNNLKHLCPYPN